jgi:hypothetical protein
VVLSVAVVGPEKHEGNKIKLTHVYFSLQSVYPDFYHIHIIFPLCWFNHMHYIQNAAAVFKELHCDLEFEAMQMY